MGLSSRLLGIDSLDLRLVCLRGAVSSDLVGLDSLSSDSLNSSISINIVLLLDYFTIDCLSNMMLVNIVSIRSSLVRA